MMKMSEIKGMKEYLFANYLQDNTIHTYMVLTNDTNELFGSWENKAFAELIAKNENCHIITVDEIDFEAVAWPLSAKVLENCIKMKK